MSAAAIQKLFRRLDRRLHAVPREDEVARPEPPPELDEPRDEVEWLDRYLFDREWRWLQR